ncbi:MAG: HAD hydrolase-like protein [Proteobacteria bacterium]|nr:HAD hydrolase-like protein [Pseudomonadota bacterium]
MIGLSHIKGIIWDLDNTLYRLEQAHIKAFNIAIARAALASGVDMDFSRAVELAARSYIERGQSGRIFIEEYGVKLQDLHYTFHHYIDEKIIEACRRTQDLFAEIHVSHALVTHASKEWAQRVLKQIGLTQWFPDDRLFALETFDFAHKYESTVAFDAASQAMNLDADRIMMVEDVHANLRIPYELGMTTALIHHGQAPAEIPPYVHLHCENSVFLLEKLQASIASG